MLKISQSNSSFSFLPKDAYAARIQALFKTYGTRYSFAQFWIQANTAAVSRVDGVMTVCCDSQADFEELRAFIQAVGFETLVCSYDTCVKLGYTPFASSYIVKYTADSSEKSEGSVPDLKQVYSLLCTCGFSMGDYNSFLADFAARLNKGTAKISAIVSDSVDACASALFIGEKSVLLGAVATNPEKRGQGLASKLVSALAAEMKGKKKEVFLFCREDGLLDFYKKIGFVDCGKWTEVKFSIKERS